MYAVHGTVLLLSKIKRLHFMMPLVHPGITVGLQQTSYDTPETAGPLSVCVQMFVGNLERNVSLTVTTSDGTAVGNNTTCSHKVYGIVTRSYTVEPPIKDTLY